METSTDLRLTEWERLGPTPGSALAGLVFDRSAAARAEALSRAGQLIVTELRQGIAIEARSHVGRIQLGPLKITIVPKIEGVPLIDLLRYAYGLRDLRLSEEVEHDYAWGGLQELLCAQLAAEAEELLQRGIHRTYRRLTEPLTSPRGRIDFTAYARQRTSAVATLPCDHFPRSDDTLLNQMLMGGLQLAARLTDELSLRVRLRLLGTRLDGSVSQLPVTAETLAAANRNLNRLTKAYRPALALIALLAQGNGLTHQLEEQSARAQGFLFDMNRFFQVLLSRFLREHLSGYDVLDEHRLTGVVAYEPEHNPRRRAAPVLRPDFAILQGQRLVALLDAKYRDLWRQDLPRDMLYQLGMYALSQIDHRTATILYPSVTPGAREARIAIRDPKGANVQGHVVLRPVDLIKLQGLLRRRNTTEGEAYAQELAFGRASVD